MADPAKRERAIFEGALELSSPGERRAYINWTCGNDAELRKRVEGLIRAHEEAGGFLPEDDPNRAAAVGGRVGTTSTLSPVTEKPGDRIGRYKLREKVGEGGCGVVYVAEQEEPVRRRVALKVIKLGMDTRSVIARFEAERQALAIMDHPNVAKVLDAGATETGRPFFVMELVRGIKITDYCDQNKLSTRERLDLFIKVCQAVQHAHQKGIIHRDIKPSNILVTLHDGVPVPKIIDFGIAKATEGRLTDLTVYTELNQFIGTPAYMSPEQAEMSGLDIDTRSDIYSLGVLLYELLTGQPPFDPTELLRQGLDEIRRTIREVEPPRPSTRLSTLAVGSLGDVAHHRHTDAPKLLSLIRGDLDWIVMKCMEKDRTRRYETANGLAADIQRHLKQEPVVARPPSAAYRFQKLVRRNKLSVAAGGAVAAALIAGLAVSLAALARERAANARAEQRLAAALQQVESVLTNDLPAVRRLAGSTKASKSMLRNTLSFMSALAPNAADNPQFLLASARVHANLAMLQGSRWGVSLGDPEAALASASNAWTLLRSIPTGTLPRVRVREMTFRAEEATGMALEALGREDEALAHYERMLALATELDQQLPRTGNCRWTSEAHKRLAGYFMAKGKWDQMREHNDHLLRDPYLLTNAASEDLDRLSFTGLTLWWRAVYYNYSVSNWNVALDYYRQSLSFDEAYLKQANFDQITEYLAVLSLVNIGVVLCKQRNYAEGLPIIDEALHRMESLAARDKANWIFQDLLTEILLAHAERRAAAARAGEFSSAECLSLLEQARTSYHRCLERMNASAANASRQKSWVHYGADDVKRGLEGVEADLAWTYRRAGRLDDAEAIYREGLTRTESSLTAMLNLGELLLQRAKTNTVNPSLAEKQKSEAEQLLRKLREEVRALGRKVHGPEDADTLQAMQALANSYSNAGHREEALKLREEVLALRRKILGPEHSETIYAMDWLAISYFDAGRREEALKLREEVVALCRRILGPEHRDTLRTMHNLALSYAAATRRQDALKLREELLALRRKVNGPEHRDTLLAMNNLAISYFDAGRREEALKLREEVLALSRKVNGPDHLDTVRAMSDLAEFHWRRGDFAAAEPLYREVLQIRRARLGSEDEPLLQGTASLARLLVDWAWAERDAKSEILPRGGTKSQMVERAREGETLLRECLAIRLRGTNSTHWRTGEVKSRLGAALVSLAVTDPVLDAEARIAKLAEAETLLLEGNERLQRSRSAEGKYKRDALERLVRLYEAWGKPDKVSEWRQKLETLDKTGKEPSSSEEQTQ